MGLPPTNGTVAENFIAAVTAREREEENEVEQQQQHAAAGTLPLSSS